jgi:sugar lactone lactonase YvrE
MDQQASPSMREDQHAHETGTEIRRIWDGPATLGECPLWDERNQRLYWIDSIAKKIWQADADGGNAQAHAVPDIIGSIGLCDDGRLIAGLAGGFAFIDIRQNEIAVERLGNPEPGSSDTRLNDGKVDRQGRFWCGSMNRDFAAANAALYRLDPDLAWHQVDTGFTVSNGIAFSLDGKSLYFSDSRVDRSYVYDLDCESGRLSNRRRFIDTTAYEGRIDGATVDSEGNYWGALFDGGAVACFSPEGNLVRLIELPVRYPTMCAFGGTDLDILYVTSATFTMNNEERNAEPLAGALFAVHGLDAKGVIEPRFVRT